MDNLAEIDGFNQEYLNKSGFRHIVVSQY